MVELVGGGAEPPSGRPIPLTLDPHAHAHTNQVPYSLVRVVRVGRTNLSVRPDELGISVGTELARAVLWVEGVDQQELERRLEALAERLIREVEVRVPSVSEGEVVTIAGPPSYRRLDCRGRAIAYVRVRPKKRLVRVDLTGRCRPPAASPLALRSSAAFTLAVRSELDIPDAVDFLARTVARGTDR